MNLKTAIPFAAIIAIALGAALYFQTRQPQAPGALRVQLPALPQGAAKSSNAKTVTLFAVSANSGQVDAASPPIVAPIIFTPELGWHALFSGLQISAYAVLPLRWQGERLEFTYEPYTEKTLVDRNCGVAGGPPAPPWWQRPFAKNPCERHYTVRYAKVESGKTAVATAVKPPQHRD